MYNKWTYYVLSALTLVYVIVITWLNIAMYGSVLHWNLSVLSLTLVIPLYLGIKMKKYSKRVVHLMSVYFVIIVVIAYFTMPNYTYDEAVSEFDQVIPTLRKHVGDESFFYKGVYYVKTEKGNYSFDIHTGEIKGVEDEFK